MSGPALRKLDSHSSIHGAALQEAYELNNVIRNLIKEGDQNRALEAGFIAVEHWETRTLAHAESEESGLYKDIAKEYPEHRDTIIKLKRDHDLLRFLVKSIKEDLNQGNLNEEVLQKFHALILVDEMHNQEEEKILPEH